MSAREVQLYRRTIAVALLGTYWYWHLVAAPGTHISSAIAAWHRQALGHS
jgi:hypothetical protein